MNNDQKIADALYDSAAGYRPALEPGINRLRDTFGLSAEEGEQRLAATAQHFADAQVGVNVAQRLHGEIVRYLISPADQATREGWALESRRMVREDFGEFGERLAWARWGSSAERIDSLTVSATTLRASSAR